MVADHPSIECYCRFQQTLSINARGRVCLLIATCCLHHLIPSFDVSMSSLKDRKSWHIVRCLTLSWFYFIIDDWWRPLPFVVLVNSHRHVPFFCCLVSDSKMRDYCVCFTVHSSTNSKFQSGSRYDGSSYLYHDSSHCAPCTDLVVEFGRQWSRYWPWQSRRFY